MRPRWARALAGALLALTVGAAPLHAQDAPTAPPPPEEGESPALPGVPSFDPRLAAALLAPTDLPPELRRDPRASGPLAAHGLSGQLVTYARRDPEVPLDNAALLGQPAGTVILVKSSIQVLSPELLTPEVLDVAIEGNEGATSAGGAAVDSTTRYPRLAIGEDSRAISLHYLVEDVPLASTAIIFRRGNVVAALNLVAMGDDPQFAQAEQLARLVDGRLAFLVGPEEVSPVSLPGAPQRPPTAPGAGPTPSR